jgi:hypothetical protein
LPDIDAELEKFAVDSRCTPQRIRDAHAPNELSDLEWGLWPATARP